MIIKVLGSGCATCKLLEKNTRESVADLGIKAEIVKVEDITDILKYKIMRTPALVIDEQVMVYGKVPSVAEIKEMIQQHNRS